MFKQWNNRNVDRLYPIGEIRYKSKIHWSPYTIAKEAAKYLCSVPNAKILDIGSGVGKFGIIAGHFNKEAIIEGIEQRYALVEAGTSVVKKLGLTNVNLIHGNFLEMDSTKYTGLYFFNSFYENIANEGAMRDTIDRNSTLYWKYTKFLLSSLCKMPVGTRVVTYCYEHAMPNSYKLVKSQCNGRFEFWIKETENGEHPLLKII